MYDSIISLPPDVVDLPPSDYKDTEIIKLECDASYTYLLLTIMREWGAVGTLAPFTHPLHQVDVRGTGYSRTRQRYVVSRFRH